MPTKTKVDNIINNKHIIINTIFQILKIIIKYIPLNFLLLMRCTNHRIHNRKSITKQKIRKYLNKMPN